jgi:hypothetical protein
VDRKALGMNRIVANLGTVARFAGYLTNYAWSDGTPTLVETGTNTGVTVGGQGSSFVYSVPCGTATRSLRLYVIIYQGTSKMTAHVSDSSSADYVDTMTDNSSATRARYTLSCRAASDGQTLTATFLMQADATGNATIDALGATYY